MNPQFWAEDGKIWFADAYNYGLQSLFLTQEGYFQTLSRLTAFISLLFPISKSPLIFNILALVVQVLPALLLISSRLSIFIPKLKYRILLGFFYLLLPNTAEVHGNITNAQWFLALTAFLILIADASKNKFWKISDKAILILSGLSGPFCILLVPVSLLYWLTSKQKQHLNNFYIILVISLLQVFGLFFLNNGGRLHTLPSFDFPFFLLIFIKQIIWGVLIGANGFIWVQNNIYLHVLFFLVTTPIIILVILLIAQEASLKLKLFILYGALVFTSSILFPSVDFTNSPVMHQLAGSSRGMRYWVIPMTVFATLLISGLSTKKRLTRISSVIVLSFSLIGILFDFRHPALIDYKFEEYIKTFERNSSKQRLTIPINPTGWTMELRKH